MKQKYVILKDEEKNRFAIKEFAELDKEMLSLLCEETYDMMDLKNAMEQGKDALVLKLRTHNMYPPGVYAEAIAEAVISMFEPDADPSTELFFEDKDLFNVEEPPEDVLEVDEDDTDVDDLLEETEISDLDDDTLKTT